MVKEESYYDSVMGFLEKQGCFYYGKKKGPKYVGYADVLGIRDIGSRYSGDFEILAVEVKTNLGNFVKSLGQALGYSLFAHRCYLAIVFEDNEEFKLHHREMAARLGVGLMEIRNKKCKEIFSSSYHAPINCLVLMVLDNLNYGKCTICGNIFHRDEWTKDMKKATANKDKYGVYYDNVVMDKGHTRQSMFDDRKPPERWTCICHTCIEKFGLYKAEKKT